MSNLVNLSKGVEEQLAGTEREPHWETGEAERYMADVDVRRGRFEEIAVRLNDTLIQPRLETLASYSSNASLIDNESAGRLLRHATRTEGMPITFAPRLANNNSPAHQLHMCS